MLPPSVRPQAASAPLPSRGASGAEHVWKTLRPFRVELKVRQEGVRGQSRQSLCWMLARKVRGTWDPKGPGEEARVPLFLLQSERSGLPLRGLRPSTLLPRVTDTRPCICSPQGGVKVLITGPWQEASNNYSCLFDQISVPASLIQPGVLRCYCPGEVPPLPGARGAGRPRRVLSSLQASLSLAVKQCVPNRPSSRHLSWLTDPVSDRARAWWAGFQVVR